MNDNSAFSQPIIEDPNSTVGDYPWEGNSGATQSYDTNSMAVMSNPAPSFVQPSMDATSMEFQGIKEEVGESAPEGADMGQPLDAGGDEDGQNFGQDQGSQDTMSAESINLPVVGSVSVVALVGITIVGLFLWNRRGE